ncbi:MAG: glycosyltransferase family 39 protein [Myxococcota bacterium]|nr:glycosyltransferase family 39 protein [Myxococcota bacterium]
MQTSPSPLLDRSPDRRDHLVAVALTLLYLIWLIITQRQVGIPRDESIYFYAADRFSEWFQLLLDEGLAAFSRQGIDRGFAFNHEHPMLMKALFGLSHELLHKRWDLIGDPLLAYRLPTICFAAGLLWLCWRVAYRCGGRWAGLGALLALAMMPRLAFHARLACFDLPVTAMWFFAAWSFWSVLEGRRHLAVAGVTLGLAQATKLNTFFAPFTFALALALYLWRRKRHQLSWRSELRAQLRLFLLLGLITLVVFYLHWPWLYYDTFRRVGAYIGFHARHVHYPVDYLGTLYYAPPFPLHFPFLFSALTIPAGTLALGLWGSWRLLERARARPPQTLPLEGFILCNLMVPILVIALPNTPIFGGTKHWMPAMPFFAIAAGLAFAELVGALQRRWRRQGGTLAALVLLLLFFSESAWATASYSAHGPAYYNSIAGGPPGAAALRMPRNFWGYSSVELLPYLNKEAPKEPLVFWHNATGIAVHHYKRAGRLSRGVGNSGDWTGPYSEIAIYHDHREKRPEEADLWWGLGSEWPVEGFFIDGVQQIGLYHRSVARRRTKAREAAAAREIKR